jgi:hypothetical protein
MDKQAGDHVKLRILRQNEREQKEEKEVDLELSNLAMTRPAP